MLRRYAKALMVRVSIVICLPEIRIFASKAAVKRVRIARDASMDGRVPQQRMSGTPIRNPARFTVHGAL